MTTTPIRYTSRTFATILNDINSDPDLIDKPEWFKRIWAGVGDMLSMIENASANQSYLRTAFTRQAVIDLCQLIDYELTPRTESSGSLIFYLKSTTSFPITVLSANMVGSTQGSLSISSKRFEARANKVVAAVNETFTANASDDKLTVARVYTTGERVRLTTSASDLPAPLVINTDYYAIYVSATTIRLATTLANAYAGTYINITDAGTGTHTIHLYCFQQTCYSQQSISSAISLGASDAITENQEFDLPHLWVLRDTLVIVINSDTWTRVNTFVNSISTSKHFRLLYKKDGKSYIRFGDGTYGAIPAAFDIYASYAYGGGGDCNVSTANKINLYAGSDANIDSVSNPSTFTGGAEEESLESAKYVAPMLLKARDRFVTVEDGEALVLAYGGVIRVKINKNYYGLLTAQCVMIPSGGGLPSSSLKSAIKAYLEDRTLLESVTVTCDDPTYYTFNVTSAMKMKSGYLFADALPFYRLCVRLLVGEVTNQIVSLYQASGIDDAVTFINTKWTDYTFTTEDYSYIQILLQEIYDRDLIPDFGQYYNITEVGGFINMFVEGCDYITWTLPALPVQLATDEIATDGTMILTEIV